MSEQPTRPDGVVLPQFADAEDPMERIRADASKLARWERLSKSTRKAYLLWLFLGFFGGHRFYLGYAASGIFLLLMTALGLILAMLNPVGYFILFAPGLWLCVDAAIIPAIVRHQNAHLIEEILR